MKLLPWHRQKHRFWDHVKKLYEIAYYGIEHIQIKTPLTDNGI